MKTLIIVYLIFLNGVLLAQYGPYGQGYPNGNAYNTFNSMTNSDSTPEQKRRRDERRAREKSAMQTTRDSDLDIVDIMKSFLELQKFESKQKNKLNENAIEQKILKTEALNQTNDCQITINQLLKQNVSQKDKEAFLKLDCYQKTKNEEIKILNELIKEKQNEEIKLQKNILNQYSENISILEQNKNSIKPIEKNNTETKINRDLDIGNYLCEKEKTSMLEKANSEYEVQMIKNIECQKNNNHKKYKNFMGEFDNAGDYWFNMIFGTFTLIFFGALSIILVIFWIRDMFDSFPMNGA